VSLPWWTGLAELGATGSVGEARSNALGKGSPVQPPEG